jgi:hypothetical protein
MNIPEKKSIDKTASQPPFFRFTIVARMLIVSRGLPEEGLS